MKIFIENEKGVSLIITFFVMIIILAVVLSVSVILYSELKVIRNIGNSVVAFYGADSGVEKVLYYDRQVLPKLTLDPLTYAKRGLCSMCAYDQIYNPDACVSGSDDDPTVCNSCQVSGDGCDTSNCTNCTVTFNTAFDKISYSVTAKVDVPNIIYFDVQSKGKFSDANRGIEITSPYVTPE